MKRTKFGLLIGLVCVAVVLAFGGLVLAERDDPAHQGSPAAAASHASDGAPLRGELGFWSILVFLGLLAVLGRFAWRPLVEAIDAREKHIRDSVQDAERARDQAKALLAEHDKKLAEVQNEVRAILDEARRDAQQTQTEILKQAQSEAQNTRDRAKREIEQARDQALKELFDQAADLATEIAGRIVQRTLNPQDHRDLVQKALNELPSKN